MIEKKYCYGTKENREFLNGQAESLLEFGKAFPSPYGSSYWLGDDGTPCKERNRETWITCRMIHSYSLGAFLSFPESEEKIDAGLKGLCGELKDTSHGGWFASVTSNGDPVGPKQCYAHAFVMLSASSALLAGSPGAKELLEDAEQVFDQYFWDDEKGLAVDTWNIEFTKLDPYRGINANMHTTEAFLALADATGDEQYRVRAGRIIDHVIGWASSNSWRIPEHYHSDWSMDLECNANKKDDQFKPYGATPGHGIEWARLITQWTMSSFKEDPSDQEKKEKKKTYLDAAEHLYQRAVEDGWCADGKPGIVYTTDWEGKPVVHDRMHWTLAEAINTSSVLYDVTGKERYAADYAEFLHYLDESVLDHRNGSWFHQLDAQNRPIGTVWPGKCDLYHALQSMLIPQYRSDLSIAKAVKQGAKRV